MKTHGHKPRKGKPSGTYVSWMCMKQRCNRTDRTNSQFYHDKGITYDPRRERFENFLADMGERPEGCTLDRIDCEQNYSRENCRWATIRQQNLNRGGKFAAKNVNSLLYKHSLKINFTDAPF